MAFFQQPLKRKIYSVIARRYSKEGADSNSVIHIPIKIIINNDIFRKNEEPCMDKILHISLQKFEEKHISQKDMEDIIMRNIQRKYKRLNVIIQYINRDHTDIYIKCTFQKSPIDFDPSMSFNHTEYDIWRDRVKLDLNIDDSFNVIPKKGYEETLKTYFSCNNCSKIMYPQKNLACGHSFCNQCIATMKIRRLDDYHLTPRIDILCSVCGCSSTAYVECFKIKNILEQYGYIECKLKCGWRGTVDDYNEHKNSCENTECYCICDTKFPIVSIDVHDSQCYYRSVKCSDCGMIGYHCLLEQHRLFCIHAKLPCDLEIHEIESYTIYTAMREELQNYFKKVDVNCPFCSENIPFYNIAYHTTYCGLAYRCNDQPFHTIYCELAYQYRYRPFHKNLIL